MSTKQFGRKALLALVEGSKGLDLSAFKFTFRTTQMEVGAPNSASIRVYNLSESLVRSLRGEFSRVVLQAGYDNNFGVIFDGTVKQYRTGRLSSTDTYLDILAADGDRAYNWAVVNRTLASPNSGPEERIKAAIEAMGGHGVQAGYVLPSSGGILPRGKVLFGMARSLMRTEADNMRSSWHIQGGFVNVVPLNGYLPGQVVKLTAASGLIGLPEQTEQGVQAKCLLNAHLRLGGLVQIDNRSINQTLNFTESSAPGPAYNQYVGIQLLAKTTNDGLYRVFVLEHEGDTFGNEWYSHLTCLAVSADTKQVKTQ